jgi:hypothetical protein
MARKPEAIPINEPAKIVCKSKTFLIKAKFRAPIKKLANGGARINLSSDFDGFEAIIFITNKRWSR